MVNFIYNIAHYTSMCIIELPKGEKFEKAAWPELTPAKVVIFIYLLHHPSNPTHLARLFAKSNWKKEKAKGVYEQRHASEYMREMAKEGILYVPEKPKEKLGKKRNQYFKPGPSNTYFVNPYLIERYSGRPIYNSKFNIPSIIRESSPSENIVIRGISNTYKKFDILTIFIHLQTLAEKSLDFLSKKEFMDYWDPEIDESKDSKNSDLKILHKELGSPFIEFEKLCAIIKKAPKDPTTFFERTAEYYAHLINTVIWDERVQEPKRHRNIRHP